MSEACALDTTDIDRDRYGVAMVIVRRGKGGKSRQVPLGGAADRALLAYVPTREALGTRPTDRALFVNADGERLTPRSVQRMVKKWAIAGGIHARATPHALRHTFATHLLDEDVDLRSIQELLVTRRCRRRRSIPRSLLDHLMKVYDAAHPRAMAVSVLPIKK